MNTGPISVAGQVASFLNREYFRGKHPNQKQVADVINGVMACVLNLARKHSTLNKHEFIELFSGMAAEAYDLYARKEQS